MLRIRFKLRVGEVGGDFRPTTWPILYPYWCTGEGLGPSIYGDEDVKCFVMVAYAEDEDQLMRWWPEAFDLSVTKVDKIEFTDRFPKPKWYPIKTDSPTEIVRMKNDIARKVRQIVCTVVLREENKIVTDDVTLDSEQVRWAFVNLSDYFQIEFYEEDVDICSDENIRKLIDVVCDKLKEEGETIK